MPHTTSRKGRRFRSFLLLIPILITTSLDLRGQEWEVEWVYPKPAGGPVRGIDFIDEDRGWLIYRGLDTWKTSDGGLTWDQVEMDTVNPYIDNYLQLQVIDDDWAYASIQTGQTTGYVRTTNGGRTWEKMETGDTVYDRFSQLTFVNRNTGWAEGHSKVWKTTDAGESWAQLDDSLRATSVFPLSETVIFMLTDSREGVKRSEDGGETWTKIAHDADALVFVDSLNGWSYEESGVVSQTKDGGWTWGKVRAFPGRRDEFVDMRFADSLAGFVKTSRRMYTTQDGGLTWSVGLGGEWTYTRRFTSQVGSEVIGTSNVGGEIVVMNMRDGSRRRLSSEDWGIPKKLHFFDEKEGILLCSDSPDERVIRRTTDGGETWEAEAIIEGFDWRQFAAHGDTVWATAWDELSVSYDRGRTWRIVLKGVLRILPLENRQDFVVSLIDGNRGVISRPGNLLFFSGSEPPYSRTLASLEGEGSTGIRKVTFKNESFGWMSEKSTVYFTEDGGETWYRPLLGVTSGTPFFLGDSLGFSGLIPMTVSADKGKYWATLEYERDYPAQGRWYSTFMMIDRDRGYAIEDFTLLGTQNGGRSWQKQADLPMPVTEPIVFSSPDVAWVLGAEYSFNGLVRIRRKAPASVEGATLITPSSLNLD